MKPRPALVLTLFLCNACAQQCSEVSDGELLRSSAVLAGSLEWSITYPEEADIIRKLQRLNDELHQARHELAVHRTKVDMLTDSYHQLQVAFIGRRVENFEHTLGRLRKDREAYFHLLRHRLPQLFVPEREALAQVMDVDQNYAMEGQAVMDRILRIITELNKDKESLSQPNP